MTINSIKKKKNRIDYLCASEVSRGAIRTFQAIYLDNLLCFIILQTAV